jgi:hypothetical protein
MNLIIASSVHRHRERIRWSGGENVELAMANHLSPAKSPARVIMWLG